MNWIKEALLIFISTIFSLWTVAQNTPQGIYYQAVARGDDGSELINQEINLRLHIEDMDQIIYTEFHTPMTDQFGLFELVIGAGQVELGDFSSINWGAESHFLTIDLDSGSGFEEVSSTQFLTVPYSFYASVAGSVENTDDADPDPQNEIVSSFQINGSNLELIEAGTSFNIPLEDLADDGDWIKDEENLTLVSENLNVGINSANPNSSLTVNGSLALNVISIISVANETQEQTLGVNNNVVICDVAAGDINITLPPAGDALGRVYFIKKYDSLNTNYGIGNSRNVRIIPSGTELIDNTSEFNLDSNDYQQIHVISDGENWFILNYSANPN